MLQINKADLVQLLSIFSLIQKIYRKECYSFETYLDPLKQKWSYRYRPKSFICSYYHCNDYRTDCLIFHRLATLCSRINFSKFDVLRKISYHWTQSVQMCLEGWECGADEENCWVNFRCGHTNFSKRWPYSNSACNHDLLYCVIMQVDCSVWKYVDFPHATRQPSLLKASFPGPKLFLLLPSY